MTLPKLQWWNVSYFIIFGQKILFSWKNYIFTHYRVGVIIKGPEPSPPRRFPSNVKRFRPSVSIHYIQMLLFLIPATEFLLSFSDLLSQFYFSKSYFTPSHFDRKMCEHFAWIKSYKFLFANKIMKMNPPMVLIFFKFPQMEKGGIPKIALVFLL